MTFRTRNGSVIGRDHLKAMRNRQDGFAAAEVQISGALFQIGVVSDGCGSGKQSEVAAILQTAYIASDITMLLSMGTPMLHVPSLLYPRVVGFLHSILRSTIHAVANVKEMASFIENYLLATALGFIIGPEDTIVFVSGDGVVVINDEVISIDKENRPDYIGYHLVPSFMLKTGGTPLPQSFSCRLVKTVDLRRLLVATDGFEVSVVPEIWSHMQHGHGVQRWLNAESMNNHRFKDDATVIAVEREAEDASSD